VVNNNNNTVENFTPEQKEILKRLEYDLKNHPIRALTTDERNIFSRALWKAQDILPSFRDALSVLRPFLDATAKTAYTDVHARVGLSYWFLYQCDKEMQAIVLLHECMHVLNNHFVRAESLGIGPDRMNVAGDLEINTVLEELKRGDFSMLLTPKKFNLPPFKTMEFYADALSMNEDDSGNGSGPSGQSQSGQNQGQQGTGENNSDTNDGQGQGSSGEGSENDSDQSSSQNGSGSQNPSNESNSGNGSSSDSDVLDDFKKGMSQNNKSSKNARHCDESTPSRSDAADEAGIERITDTERSLAQRNTTSRIKDELNSGGQGYGTAHELLKAMLNLMEPPKVRWQELLRRAVSNAYSNIIIGKTETSYRKVNRRYSGKVIFPGQVSYAPVVYIGIDTSGSMTKSDYESVLIEAESIVSNSSRQKGGLTVFSVDTEIKDIAPLKSVREIDLYGGGGTDMSVAFKYANSIPRKKRPNIVVLGTDGYTDWQRVEQELLYSTYYSVILVTTEGGFSSVPESLHKISNVINISDDSRLT
jgi:predicted metal-dependent peptidase